METGIGIVFLLAGLAALAGSLALIRAGLHRQRHWRKATGVVNGYQESHRNGRVMYRPEIHFKDDWGQPHLFAASKASQKRGYKIGASLSVIYSPDAPDKAAVNSFSELYAGPVIIALLAAGFIGVACALIFCKSEFS